MKKQYFELIEKFEGIIFTVIGGVFLVLSFILNEFNISFPINPAFFTVLISGLPLLSAAITKLINNRGILKISSALLVSIAMIAAILVGDLFAAGEVAFIMAIGEIIEEFTTKKAKNGLKKLISLVPQTARKISAEGEIEVLAESLNCGDIIRVLSGEKIPCDGKILKGEISVDQSVLTGESLPIDKNAGDEVFCGTINTIGTADIVVTKTAQNTALAGLIEITRKAEENKAPIERTADRAASILVPLALLIAIITGIVTHDINRAVTVLVVFCPCALVLATPTAIMAAIGQASAHGVIIKSGEALEKLGRVDTFCFDKTGTLTEGRLTVSDICLFKESVSEEELLSYSCSVEAFSEHPIAKTICSYAKERNVQTFACENFKSQIGKGVSAIINGDNILCANPRQLKLLPEQEQKINRLAKNGKAVVCVVKNGVCIGAIALSDTIKENAAYVISSLRKNGIKSVLLTGDSIHSAKYFSEKLGISDVFAGLLPEDKAKKISQLKESGNTVCMIGDGVNDAPALKTASVSIAMADIGSDVSIEAADIALIGDDISKLTYLEKLSKATVNTINIGIFLSLFINIAAVLLSVLGFLNITLGALIHNLGAFFVILISALLYERKFK